MDLRVLRYFLTVSKEKSIAKASEVLHVTQPTLSRQLRDLEDEFGAQLFIRGSKTQGITLTEKGFILRKRAEELVELAERTKNEMYADEASISGDIMIGGGESDAIRIVARTAKELHKKYPGIHYHLFSGNAEDVKERLDKGLLDFGIFVAPTNLGKYERLKLPSKDRWGIIVRKDSPLAAKSSITSSELIGIPLWVSRQERSAEEFEAASGISVEKLNIAGTYNLIFNAAIMASEGFGSVLGLEKLVPTGPESNLQFVPVLPFHPAELYIAWKKYQVHSKAADIFLKKIQEFCVEFQ